MRDEPAADISVLVPVYNSAATLEGLVSRLTEVMSRVGAEYEIILVDDGSRDDSWRVLARLQQRDPRHITCIQLMRNFGQCNTVMCGMRHSRGRLVVTIDDDLQNPPEEIPRLLDAIERQDCDVVYGVYSEAQQTPFRRFGSWMATKFFQRIVGTDVPVTSFRVLKRDVVDAILNYGLNYTYIDGLISWNTQRIGQVPVAHRARKEGASGYTFGKLLLMSLNLMTNFSLLPLQVVSLCGFVTAIGGLLAGAYYFFQYVTSNIDVPGYASTIVAILVLGGLQLLSLGVLGEYVGRLHMNVNRKPQYTVRKVLAGDQSTITESELVTSAQSTKSE